MSEKAPAHAAHVAVNVDVQGTPVVQVRSAISILSARCVPIYYLQFMCT